MRPLILTLVTLTSVAAAADTRSPWTLLGAVELYEVETDAGWRVVKKFDPALRAAAAVPFRIEGYLVPVVAQAEYREILLVDDPAACPFCGIGGYGPVLQVFFARPIAALEEGARITVEGTLELVDDPESYQTIRLNEARRVTDN